MRPIIEVRGLSKLYRLGRRATRSRPTLREALTLAPKSWFWRKGALGRAETDKIWALDNVSFEIKPGEVVGIIGRNGAGKSTLLKILSRITKPTAGYADIYGSAGCLMEVGTGFHPDLSGRENIFFNGALLGMKRQQIERRFDEIVDFAETERFLDTPVKHYSSGMYLRLAFAIAAHLEPEVLLLDEVLAVGDARFQNKCLMKMKEVSRAGRTVLFVSHNMAAVQQMCSRVFLFQAGRLTEEGTAPSVATRYLADASYCEDGDFDLSDHPARLPGCRPVIQRLRLYGGDKEPSARFYPGQPMVVEMLVSSEATIREPRIAISIEDSSGQRITTAATYFEQERFPDIEGQSYIRCRLPQLRLGSGKYLLSISIDNKYKGMIDGLHRAAWFEVIWRNSFGNGEPFFPYYGPVLTTSLWERVE